MTRHVRTSFPLLAALLLLLSATTLHAGTQVASWSLDPPTVLTNILKDIERDGPRADIILNLKRFIEEHPKSKVTDEAALRLAYIYLASDDIGKAKVLFQRILRDYPFSAFKAEALYGLAYTSQAVAVVFSVAIGIALRSIFSGASTLEIFGPQSAKCSGLIMSGDS